MITTRVWFETHSTTTDNEHKIATGWLPGELSAVGRQQARALGDRISRRRPSVIFTSDLRRATQTVSIALEQARLTVPVVCDQRLRECDYGRLNGAPHDQLQSVRCHYLDLPHPGGESWQAAVQRATDGVRDAVGRHPSETIMIVGHIATRLAVEQLATGRALSELLVAPFCWQPGWSYDLGA